jgi:Ca2+-binding EF-hand superfamily protein
LIAIHKQSFQQSVQEAEFTAAFKLMDGNDDGNIELFELKRVIDIIGDDQWDDKFLKKLLSRTATRQSCL